MADKRFNRRPDPRPTVTSAISWTLPPRESLRDVWRLESGDAATPLEPGSYRFVADLLSHDRVLEVAFTVR